MEVILIVIVCSNISFVKLKTSNYPVAEFKLINGELEIYDVPVESYKLYESTQLEEKVVAEENWGTENIFNGVANDVTYPIISVVVPIEGMQVTTVDY